MRAAALFPLPLALWLSATAVPAQPMFPLGQNFTLLSVNGADTAGAVATLEVVADGSAFTARGSGGCNSWSGAAAIQDERLTISRIRSTRMACVPAVMAVERRFFTALERVRRWRMEGPALVLEGDGASLRLGPTGAPPQ